MCLLPVHLTGRKPCNREKTLKTLWAGFSSWTILKKISQKKFLKKKFLKKFQILKNQKCSKSLKPTKIQAYLLWDKMFPWKIILAERLLRIWVFISGFYFFGVFPFLRIFVWLKLQMVITQSIFVRFTRKKGIFSFFNKE